jgi:hypothetical protein
MIFTSEESTLELQILGYQFPDIHEDWDANWLIISGSVTHPKGSWRFSNPCLTTFELEQLAEWLDGVAHGIPEPDSGYFTEPCLEFRFGSEPQPTIKVALAHEGSPPWLTGDDRLEGITLRFPIPQNDPVQLARAAREFLAKFPERGLR